MPVLISYSDCLIAFLFLLFVVFNPFDTVGTYMSHGTNVSQLRKVEEIQCRVKDKNLFKTDI